eukprot:gene12582-15371_t
MKMGFGHQLSKVVGAAAVGLTLAGPVMPLPVMADGAVSISTVYRARNNYGAKINDLASAVEKGDFGAFEDKKVSNAFDLFISGSNALNSKIDKQRKAEETKILADIKSAVKSKDATKLKAAYNNFVKVADLKSDFKPNELGQTDSSGYSPTYGTKRQYIYQR